MKTLLVSLLVLAAILLAVAAYMGSFRSIDISERDEGPFTLVYRDMAAGDMSKVGEITTALNAELESQGFVNRKPLDIFYPDGRGEIGFAHVGIDGEGAAHLSSLQHAIESDTIERRGAQSRGAALGHQLGRDLVTLIVLDAPLAGAGGSAVALAGNQ